MGKLNGKVAFITGAAHEPGRSIATALGREGADIVAFDVAKSLPDLTLLQQDIEALDRWCLTVTGDIRTDYEIQYAVERAIGNFGRIDILVNNADSCVYAAAHELAENEWDETVGVNLKGGWLVARHVIPVMIRQHAGVIINNSSVGGLRGLNRLSHYVASKWGLVGLTKSWAIELAPHNIRVNSIHPTSENISSKEGLISESEQVAVFNGSPKTTVNLSEVYSVEPEDVSAVVLYLVSDDARYVTGGQFVIDAGLLTQ
ncbi:mycofactocin-coupled SDR family oxidoreductase [Spirosoma daeguense]